MSRKYILRLVAFSVLAATLYVGYDLGSLFLWNTDYDKLLAELYSGTVPTVETWDVDSLQEAHPDLVVLDTRSPEEYAVSHLASARLVDFEAFMSAPDDLGFDSSTPVLLYCSVGYRSERVGEELLELGFQNVFNLYGGIFQWANEDWPLVNGEGQDTDFAHGYGWPWSRWLDEAKRKEKSISE